MPLRTTIASYLYLVEIEAAVAAGNKVPNVSCRSIEDMIEMRPATLVAVEMCKLQSWQAGSQRVDCNSDRTSIGDIGLVAVNIVFYRPSNRLLLN